MLCPRVSSNSSLVVEISEAIRRWETKRQIPMWTLPWRHYQPSKVHSMRTILLQRRIIKLDSKKSNLPTLPKPLPWHLGPQQIREGILQLTPVRRLPQQRLHETEAGSLSRGGQSAPESKRLLTENDQVSEWQVRGKIPIERLPISLRQVPIEAREMQRVQDSPTQVWFEETWRILSSCLEE